MKRQYNELQSAVAITTSNSNSCEASKLKKRAVITSYPSPNQSLTDVQRCLTASTSRPITPVDKIIDSLALGPPSPTRSKDEINICSISYLSPIVSPSSISCPTPASSPVSTAAISPITVHSPLSIDIDDDKDIKGEITIYLNPFTALHFTPLAPFNNAPYPFAFVEPPLNQNFERYKSPPPIFLASLTGKSAAKKLETKDGLLPSPDFSLPPSQVGNGGHINPNYTSGKASTSHTKD